ncbi:MAG: bifunctional DNA-formamidopyrimidine glycosylase/DNA-(apurinic or apyrimidinic site) lyase [Chloroflexi bacterium]|nr:bifunctional DNA-formamidopyrimidine glycosylase/DNA-(apurinic or apyrimidinic site) lyase [Chloroflexota bacterium]
MPELPEVETIKNELLPHVVGRTVTGIVLFWERMVRRPAVGEFRSRLVGQRIAGLARRGKYLLFGLSGGETLVIHLRMSGSLLVKPASAELDRFTRAVIRLDEDTALHFRDVRKFGAMWLVKSSDEVVGKLGPEPLEAGFTPEVLAERLHRRKAPIKAILLDQDFLAGVGNMYADEALFAAGIHPLRPGGSLSREEVERLFSAVRRVLQAAIDNKGASVNTYLRPGGELGTAHLQFQVAHRGGRPCPVCGTPVQRLPIRNRGSYFCPRCQPEQ